MRTKKIGNYVVDTTSKTINGHYELNLIVGKNYRICYGINQGVYEYLGKTIDVPGQYLFKNRDNSELFGFYGDHAPFEFTRIVRK
jgi:hypothetical protein